MRTQLQHANVQNSISATRPNSPASVSGSPPGVFNHGCTPAKSGAGPKSGNADADAACLPDRARGKKITFV